LKKYKVLIERLAINGHIHTYDEILTEEQIKGIEKQLFDNKYVEEIIMPVKKETVVETQTKKKATKKGAKKQTKRRSFFKKKPKGDE